MDLGINDNFNISDIMENQEQCLIQPMREEYAEQKRVEKTMCRQMRALALAHAFSGREPFTRYLDMQARLGNLSAGNTLLVMSQNPAATDVRSFDAWKAADRSIKTGETGLLIIEANPYEMAGEIGSDGAAAQFQSRGFNVRRRFDISQTYGLPLTPPQKISFDPVQRIRALTINPPARIMESEKPMDIAAYYDTRERVIFVSDGHDAETTFADMAVAIAQASFHPEYQHAGTKLTAFCAGYILCKRAGMKNLHEYERFQFDPSYIPKENRMETLSDAVSLAAALQARMERNMQKTERPATKSEHTQRAAKGR